MLQNDLGEERGTKGEDFSRHVHPREIQKQRKEGEARKKCFFQDSVVEGLEEGRG